MSAAAVNRVEMIPGPVGLLEATITEVGERQKLAVLCHPHSQYGGSMHDSVLGTLSDACTSLGVSVLTFNFRSVGASEGRFAEGIGEVDDVLAVLQWASEHYPDAELTLGGYSFGAAMALLAAARSEQSLQRLVLVAPPIQMVESLVLGFNQLGPRGSVADLENEEPAIIRLQLEVAIGLRRQQDG